MIPKRKLIPRLKRYPSPETGIIRITRRSWIKYPQGAEAVSLNHLSNTDLQCDKNCSYDKKFDSPEVFKRCPEVKQQLRGGEFWGKGYFVNTVGQHGAEKKIAESVRNEGVEKSYKKLMSDHQLRMFD